MTSSREPAAVERAGDFCWGALAARVLHPVQVEIIEALRWIDRPLTATDFLRVFGAKRGGLRIEHHLRRLTKLDALKLDDASTSPNYNPGWVEQALLGVAVDLHPRCLTVSELTLRIAANPDDAREVRTIAEAIRSLRRCGLFRFRVKKRVVEPTPAALRAFALLTR